jgi:DNA-binding transcriptional LysR family regulator
MELYHLRTFVAVAEEGNLSRAAERLNLSQPAVSAHVKALEEELGVGLFIRTVRGMDLTDSGKRLTATARDALGRAQDLVEQAKVLRKNVTGDIILSRNTDPDYLRLPTILCELARENPQALVHIDCRDSYDVARSLKAGELHVGFAYGEFTDDPQVTALALGMATVRVVGPLKWKHILDKASLADLAELPWIWYHERCPYVGLAEKLLSEVGGRPKTAAIINDEHTIRALVASGSGIAILRDDLACSPVLGQELAVWPGGALPIPINLVALTRRLDEPEVKAATRAACLAWGRAQVSASA